MAENATVGNLEIQLNSDGKKAAEGVRALASAFTQLSSSTAGMMTRLASIAKSFQTIVKSSQAAAGATGAAGVAGKATGASTASTKATEAAQKGVAAATKQATQAQKQQNKETMTAGPLSDKLVNGLTRVGSVMRTIAGGAANAGKSLFNMFRRGAQGSNGLLRNLQLLRVNIYNFWYLFTFVGGAFGSLIQKASDWEESLHFLKVAYSQNEDAARGAAQAAYDFYDNISKSTGLSLQPMLEMTATFKAMANAMGMVGEYSDKISQGFTQLSYDYASLNNKDFEYVSQKFQSALAGQTKGIREFGMDITEASLNEELFRSGINATASDLNRSQRAILIYNTVMRQASRTGVMGDFVNSIKQPANMIRILRDQISMLGAAFGQLFLPMIQRTLPWVIGFTKSMGELLARIANFFGIKPVSLGDVAGGGGSPLPDDFEDAEDAAEGINQQLKKMKDYVTGLDELNILRPPEDGLIDGIANDIKGLDVGLTPIDPYDFLQGMDPISKLLEDFNEGIKRVANEWSKMEAAAAGAFSSIRDSWNEVMDSILGQRLADSFERVVMSSIGIFTGFFNGLKQAWDDNDLGTHMIESMARAGLGINNAITMVFTALGDWFTSDNGQVWFKAVLGMIKQIGDTIARLTDEFKKIWSNGGKETFDNHILPTLGAVVTTILQIIDAVIRVTGAFVNWGLESRFFATLSDIFKIIVDLIGQIAQDMAAWFDSPAAQPFKDAMQGIADAFEKMAGQIKLWWDNGGQQFAQMLVTKIAEFVRGITDFVSSLVTVNTLNFVSVIITALMNILVWAANNIGVVLTFVGAIVTLAGALKLINGLSTIANIVTAIMSVTGGAAAASAGAGAGGFLGGLASGAKGIPVLLGVAAAIALIGAAVAALIWAIGTLIQSVANLLDAFTRFTRVVISDVLPNWDELKELTEDLLGLFVRFLLETAEPMLGFLLNLALGLGAVGLAVSLTMPGWATLIIAMGAVALLIETIGNNMFWLAPILEALGVDFGNTFKDIESQWSQLPNVFGAAGTGAANAAKNAASKIFENFDKSKKDTQSSWEPIPQWYEQSIADPMAKSSKKLQGNVSDSFKKSKEATQSTWEGMPDWFSTDVTNPTAEDFESLGIDMEQYFKDAGVGTQEQWETMPDWFKKNVTSPLGYNAKVLADEMANSQRTAKESAKRAWSQLPGELRSRAFDPTSRDAKTAARNIEVAFSSARSGAQYAFNNFSTYMSSNVIQPTQSKFMTMGETIKGIFRNVRDDIVRSFSSAAQSAANIISRLPSVPNYNSYGRGGGVTVTVTGGGTVTYYADGGLPSPGEMFVAGEAGPELIGSYGGNRNTVMPLENSGFVQAMAAATYGAVTSAMQQSSGNGQGDVYVDGVKLGKVIRKGERLSGAMGSLAAVGV